MRVSRTRDANSLSDVSSVVRVQVELGCSRSQTVDGSSWLEMGQTKVTAQVVGAVPPSRKSAFFFRVVSKRVFLFWKNVRVCGGRQVRTSRRGARTSGPTAR